jgi:hypothetical protein
MLEYIANYQGYLDDYGLSVGGSGAHSNIWWVGTAFELTLFDPLTFSMDAMYGRMGRMNADLTDSAGNSSSMDIGSQGWLVDAALNYKLDWATPGIFGWWSSGDKENSADSGKYGRLPALGFDGGFYPVTFGGPGSVGVGTDTVLSGSLLGTLGIGIQLADISFIEDLSHTIRVAYMRGTNDHELVKKSGIRPLPLSGEVAYLTDKDYAIEVDFNHEYKIYENLSAFIEAGYIYMNRDEDVWKHIATDSDGGKYDGDNNAWKAQVLLQYNF